MTGMAFQTSQNRNPTQLRDRTPTQTQTQTQNLNLNLGPILGPIRGLPKCRSRRRSRHRNHQSHHPDSRCRPRNRRSRPPGPRGRPRSLPRWRWRGRSAPFPPSTVFPPMPPVVRERTCPHRCPRRSRGRRRPSRRSIATAAASDECRSGCEVAGMRAWVLHSCCYPTSATTASGMTELCACWELFERSLCSSSRTHSSLCWRVPGSRVTTGRMRSEGSG